MFTAGSMSYVIVGWFIGFNNGAADEALVPFAGNEDQQVRAVMYNYYQFIERTGFIEDAKALSQNRDVVFAGLSAGAAVSQFAALEFERVRGVFLFGVQRIGNAAFQANYAAEMGAFTSSWWNKFDAWPIVPVADEDELALLPADGIDATIKPRLHMLDARFWWRVNPYTNVWERMTGALAEPCARAGDATCTLNVEDHAPKAHFDSLKACVGASDTCRLSILAA
ncbi:hypothetical protein OEZ86_007119 [Tetradesmus obliquus]|nr:hypothetical protein OEZ86_007119 [Tetradesmus obliquus]